MVRIALCLMQHSMCRCVTLPQARALPVPATCGSHAYVGLLTVRISSASGSTALLVSMMYTSCSRDADATVLAPMFSTCTGMRLGVAAVPSATS